MSLSVIIHNLCSSLSPLPLQAPDEGPENDSEDYSLPDIILDDPIKKAKEAARRKRYEVKN